MLFHSYCTSSSPLAGGFNTVIHIFCCLCNELCNIVEFIQTVLFKLVEYTCSILFPLYAGMKTEPELVSPALMRQQLKVMC